MGEAEDVAAVKVGHSTLAWNTDVFTAFSDDPYLTGKVAVWHSLSDLLAKNSRGRWAMAMVGLPESEPISSLEQLMAGMRFVLDQEGITLVGGHTWKGDLLTVGLTILGDAEKLIRMDGLKPGDRLILTRPLGTGVLLRAMMLGIARSCWLEPMLLGLQEGNRKALEQVRASAHAITDVTGFGLLGHLAGMLRASNVSARIIQSQVPRWPGVDGLVKRGVLSTAHPQNARIARYFTGELDPVLVDPQTGGGLLVGGVDVPGVVIGEVMEKREDGMLGELV
jgi:selenide,water dikinase